MENIQTIIEVFKVILYDSQQIGKYFTCMPKPVEGSKEVSHSPYGTLNHYISETLFKWQFSVEELADFICMEMSKHSDITIKSIEFPEKRSIQFPYIDHTEYKFGLNHSEIEAFAKAFHESNKKWYESRRSNPSEKRGKKLDLQL